MARIQLTDAFLTIPEGVHTFKIIKSVYDKQFQVLKLTLKTGDGYVDTERYSIFDEQGEVNEAALGSLSYLARCATGIPDLQDLDTDKLVGCYIKGKITHKENKKNPARPFANLSEVEAGNSDDWNAATKAVEAKAQAMAQQTATAPAAAQEAPRTAAGFDLDALFGRK